MKKNHLTKIFAGLGLVLFLTNCAVTNDPFQQAYKSAGVASGPSSVTTDPMAMSGYGMTKQ